MKYIPLILMLIFNISCQTLKSQNHKKKEWLSELTTEKPAVRNLSSTYKIIVKSCKCTNQDARRTTITIKETGTLESIARQIREKCVDKMTEKLYRNQFPSILTVHSCSRQETAVYDSQ